MMQAVTGHKGGIGFVTHVRGFEVHSSLIDRGVSAIMEAAKLIDWGNRMNAENRARGATGADALFDPPYTTLHVGVIEGGTAHNITAKDCHFLMSFRCVPGEDADEWGQRYVDEVRKLEAQMQAVQPSSYIELSSSWNVPGLRPEENGEAEALVRSHVDALKRKMPHPEAAVLGCTHYPLVQEVFQDALGPDVAVYSQPNLVASSLADYLGRHPDKIGSGTEAAFLTTGDPKRVSSRATQFLRREITFVAA